MDKLEPVVKIQKNNINVITYASSDLYFLIGPKKSVKLRLYGLQCYKLSSLPFSASHFFHFL